jgi:putative spermidine/putrescine transport system permease protein
VTTTERRAWAAVPAFAIVGGLTAVSLVLTVAGSVGVGEPGDVAPTGLDGYRRLLDAPGFWPAAWFSLRVALIGTLLAVGGGALVLWSWTSHAGRRRRIAVGMVQLTVTLPHLVWSAALLATFSQSGWVARLAHAAGLIDDPGGMWLVVRDPHGIGIVLHLVSKELPFVVLVALPLARRRVESLLVQAATLGASPWQRFRSVFIPALAPALVPAAVVSFAFALGAYEPGAVLGVQNPRTLAVVALDRFRDADLVRRTDALALSTMLLAVSVVAAAALWAATRRWTRR